MVPVVLMIVVVSMLELTVGVVVVVGVVIVAVVWASLVHEFSLTGLLLLHQKNRQLRMNEVLVIIIQYICQ